jgi:coiled-coil domain-containing protein 63/114
LISIEHKKRRAEDLREEIVQIKAKNEVERDQYIKQFETLEKDYMNDKRDRETLKYEKNNKPEAIDTQPLLKHRLKKIVGSNKEKLKMIEQYKKHMKLIEEAFNDIKEKSGINTLEEITNTFIKSEEQNYALYNYLDELNRNIDNLED